MEIKPIKTEKDYDKALDRINVLWGAEENTTEGDEFEILFTLVEAYEREHYPIGPPHPIEAIKFRLDQMGMKESELNKILGTRSRKSEIFSGKRKLTLKMIRTLHQKLNIPLESLIALY
jgi:HTH-type transcriptional regulator / antitoxin HigA